ncbi:MAG: ABC transporter permease [Oligoflexia bacterium]|nr:ABC transporter permease [Oligoflexia bacterium]
MIRIALKMLVGDRPKYIGMILGVMFSSFVITQQSSIFTGIMTRTFGFINDSPLPDVWVMDPKVQYIDDIKPLQDTQLLRVRGVDGVEWATPLYKGLLKARLSNGVFQNCNVIGLDDASLVGGPGNMIKGKLEDLRRADGVIVDIVGAQGRLAKILPDGSRQTLDIGDTLELNDRRAIVVGIASISRTFQSQPVIYTTYSRAMNFAPRERKLLSFVLVKAKPGVAISDLARNIQSQTGLKAVTAEEFKHMTVMYFLKYTGIPINFGIGVLLGFLVGTAIVGQIFHNFTLDNLRYFGALKAMGASNGTLLRMIIVQAIVVGLIGYGIGVGAASMFYHVSKKSELAFRMPAELLIVSATAVTVICVIAAIFSIRKVFKLEPAIVFKS